MVVWSGLTGHLTGPRSGQIRLTSNKTDQYLEAILDLPNVMWASRSRIEMTFRLELASHIDLVVPSM